jgi:hypothetical protein
MSFYLAGFGLLAHILFWGAGLSLLITPRRWRPGWPAMLAPVGVALQSAVVWFGAQAGLVGTRSYASWAELIPFVLLVAASWQLRQRGRRRLGVELLKWRGVALLMIVVLSGLLWPFAVSSNVLTSSSLGSCDAADYAAGARVLLEFSHSDRSGFLGLTEVVQLHSVDNFFDHWMRLNHFTPSSLIAFPAAVFGFRPFELVSVMTAVFLVLSLPTVYWYARATFRLSVAVSSWICALYGLSPLLWYAVYNAAMSQLLAALAVALLNGLAVAAWQERSRGWGLLRWSGLLGAAYWLIMGAYNFIVIICLVPTVAYVAIDLWRKRDWRHLSHWLLAIPLPLAVVALVFTERTLGLVERFVLFQEYDFGWKIPGLTPEGWLGGVGGTTLETLPALLRWPLLGLLILLTLRAYALRETATKETKLLLAAAGLPVIAGYGYLQMRGALRGTNASYDAYKLLSVFLPGILAAAGFWATLALGKGRALRAVAVLLASLFLGLNLYLAKHFIHRMASPPLLVGPSLVSLGRIESMPQVGSLNLLIDDFWSRLWANSLLLHKAQYFPTYTYEGRRNTELKGEWDLHGGIIHFEAPEAREEPQLPKPYSLVRRNTEHALRLTEKAGWHDPEVLARAGTIWRWTKGDATLAIDNPGTGPQVILLRFSLRALQPRDCQFWLNGREVHRVTVGSELTSVSLPPLSVPAGCSSLELRSSLPPAKTGTGDNRLLGFAVYGLDVRWHNPQPEMADGSPR